MAWTQSLISFRFQFVSRLNCVLGRGLPNNFISFVWVVESWSNFVIRGLLPSLPHYEIWKALAHLSVFFVLAWSRWDFCSSGRLRTVSNLPLRRLPLSNPVVWLVKCWAWYICLRYWPLSSRNRVVFALITEFLFVRIISSAELNFFLRKSTTRFRLFPRISSC